MINCKLCNKPFAYINNAHLMFKHHMSQRAYKRRYGGPLQSKDYKARAYKDHSAIMSLWRNLGVIKPPSPTEEARQNLSKRMKENNPMFYPDIVKKVQEAKKGNPSDPAVSNLDLKAFEEDFKEAEKRFRRVCADCGMTEETHIMKYNKVLYPHDIPYPQSNDNPFLNQFLLCSKCHINEMWRVAQLKKGRRRRFGRYLIEPITYVV